MVGYCTSVWLVTNGCGKFMKIPDPQSLQRFLVIMIGVCGQPITSMQGTVSTDNIRRDVPYSQLLGWEPSGVPALDPLVVEGMIFQPVVVIGIIYHSQLLSSQPSAVTPSPLELPSHRILVVGMRHRKGI